LSVSCGRAGFTGRKKFDRISIELGKRKNKGRREKKVTPPIAGGQSVHLNISERFQAGSILQNALVNLSFVAGPAVIYLIIGWIIGIPF